MAVDACDAGFAGAQCTAVQSAFCPFACSGRGECVDLTNVYQCKCESGYSGVDCELTEAFISGSEKISSSIDGGNNQWRGGVTVNGIVYGIPSHSNYVLIYDPSSNKVSGSEQIPSSIDGGDGQWEGGVTVDGIVYGIPSCSDSATTEVSSRTLVSGSEQSPSPIAGGNNLRRGGVSVNGIVYGIPCNSN